MEIEQHIRSNLAENESLVLITETDLMIDETYGRRWLVVTDQRLMTLSDSPALNGFDVELALSDIKEVKTQHQVGRMSVVAETAQRRIELLSCTNSLTERFAKVTHALNAACKDKKPLVIDLEEDKQRHCERCGRLLPEADSFCPACLKKGKVLARFWRYMKPHWKQAAIVGVCVMAGTVLHLAPPYLIKRLVDDVLQLHGSLWLLSFLVLALAVTHLGATGLEMLRGRLAAWLSSRVMHDVRFDFYQAVQGLSLRRYDKTQTGALISRLTGDTQMLNFVFIEVGTFLVPALLQLIGICVMLFWLEWRLAFLVLIPTPLLIGLTIVFMRHLHRMYHRLWQRRARMTARANDAISGIRVVKAFSQEPKEISRFSVRSQDLSDATAIAESLWCTYFPILNFITMTGTFLVWYFGGLGVIHDRVTLGTLMAFLAYLTMFYGPLQMLTRASDFMNRAFTAAQRLFEITDADQELYEDPDAISLEDIRGEFNFEDVHFAYLKDRPVLKGVNIHIEPGEMIGLVGRSGVGKSTLTNLICRFYDADEGVIRLDGHDLRKVRLRDLRRSIGIVPQESYLFDGSIFDNISYAKSECTKEEVIEAAIAANAHGFIMRQPDGYDTRVGERGTRLSGGEKQRIAIARAILHDPRVLILDEATSSMDTETEELIQQALKRLITGRTTFAIAHRLSTLRNANRLLVIDDGKVVEFGSHDELLAKKGIYHMLVEMQSKLSAMKAVDG